MPWRGKAAGLVGRQRGWQYGDRGEQQRAADAMGSFHINIVKKTAARGSRF